MASYLETVREWFRARLDAPGGLSTPEGATLGLRVLAIWRSRMIAQALRNQEGGRVLGGPFAGMVYVETATEGALAPRLVGTPTLPCGRFYALVEACICIINICIS